jgi:hypothetical protein
VQFDGVNSNCRGHFKPQQFSMDDSGKLYLDSDILPRIFLGLM